MTLNVFLNYRRGSSSGSAGRLFDLLGRSLPDAKVFMDVDSIEPGIDFVKVIDQQISTCDYFIAVIGPGWSEARGEDGQQRLANPNDYVRLEIEAALRRDIRVVPVLVEGAKMPSANGLPESLQPFTRRNAFEIAHHSFASDVSELSTIILQSVGIAPSNKLEHTERTVPVSWADALFSFKGRLSRRSFWALTAKLCLITLFFQSLVLIILQGSLMTATINEHTFRNHLVIQISQLPIWWSSLAIVSKRMKDFNAGVGFSVGVIVMFIIMIAPLLASMLVVQDPSDSVAQVERVVLGVAGLVGALLLSIVWIAIGSVPGTPGLNKYGRAPDGS